MYDDQGIFLKQKIMEKEDKLINILGKIKNDENEKEPRLITWMFVCMPPTSHKIFILEKVGQMNLLDAITVLASTSWRCSCAHSSHN